MYKFICLTLVAGLLSCNASTEKKMNREMNKETFWAIIETARKQSGNDMGLRYEVLVNLLQVYEPDDIQLFSSISGAYIGAAYENYALWAACRLIQGYASDDVVLCFCAWLVSQGEEIYTNALRDPETLATKETTRYAPDYEFERLLMAAHEAIELKTGLSLEEQMRMDMENPAFIESFEKRQQFQQEIVNSLEQYDHTPLLESDEKVKKLIPALFPKLIAMFGYDQ